MQSYWGSSCCSLGALQVINSSTQKRGGNVPYLGYELFLTAGSKAKPRRHFLAFDFLD